MLRNSKQKFFCVDSLIMRTLSLSTFALALVSVGGSSLTHQTVVEKASAAHRASTAVQTVVAQSKTQVSHESIQVSYFSGPASKPEYPNQMSLFFICDTKTYEYPVVNVKDPINVKSIVEFCSRQQTVVSTPAPSVVTPVRVSTVPASTLTQSRVSIAARASVVPAASKHESIPRSVAPSSGSKTEPSTTSKTESTTTSKTDSRTSSMVTQPASQARTSTSDQSGKIVRFTLTAHHRNGEDERHVHEFVLNGSGTVTA
jgi:hypothetical protein